MKRLPADRIPQALLLVVTTAAAFWAQGRWLDPTRDTGFSWSLAYRIGHGDLLYRDIYLVYGPLSPYLLALTGAPFDFSALWYLVANWVPAIAAGWLVLEIGRRSLSILENLAVASLMLGFSLFAPEAARLVLPYYAGVVHALVLSLCALLLLRAEPERLAGRAFAAGALAGLAFGCKSELGLAALGGLLAAAAGRMPRRLAWITRVLLGFALVAGAAFAFALSCDSLSSLEENSHLWPLNPAPPPQLTHLFRIVAGLTDPQWPLAVRSAAFRFLWEAGLLAALAMLLARERSRRRYLPLVGLFAVLALWLGIEGLDLFRPSSLVCLSTSAALLVAVLAFLRRRTENRTLLMAVGVFAALAGGRTVFSSFSSGPYEGPAHLTQSLTWVLLLCLFLPGLLTGEGAAVVWARRLFAAAVFAASVPAAWSGIQALRLPVREAVATQRGTVFLDAPRARFFRELARQIAPGERVLVLPEISGADVLLDARSSSPYLNHLPGWFDEAAERRLIAHLEQDPPAAVVLFDRPLGEYGVKPFGVGYGNLLSQWCRQNYRPVAETPAGTILRPAGSDRGRPRP